MLVLVLDFVLNGFLVTSSYVAAESVAQDREAQQAGWSVERDFRNDFFQGLGLEVRVWSLSKKPLN